MSQDDFVIWANALANENAKISANASSCCYCESTFAKGKVFSHLLVCENAKALFNAKKNIKNRPELEQLKSEINSLKKVVNTLQKTVEEIQKSLKVEGETA
jgi:uncharacterized protein YlxW (UPF0749 family)